MTKRSIHTAKSETELGAYSRQLQCLYDIWELLRDSTSEIEPILRKIADVLPSGMQHSKSCLALITVDGREYCRPDFIATPVICSANITVGERIRGSVAVCYSHTLPQDDSGAFLPDEVQLVQTLAKRLGHYLEQRDILVSKSGVQPSTVASTVNPDDWRTLLHIYSESNLGLVLHLTNKMMIHLGLQGVTPVEVILQKRDVQATSSRPSVPSGPAEARTRKAEILALSDDIFGLAEKHLSSDEIIHCLMQWVSENRNSTLARVIANPDSTLRETIDAIRFFARCEQHGAEFSPVTTGAVQVHLIQRFLSEQLEFMRVAKNHLTKEDFCDLIQRMIFLPGSHGKLGGKGARYFLASRILQKEIERNGILQNVRLPKTWYVATGSLFPLLCSNDMDHVINQKYKSLDHIRKEYPLIIHFFRMVQFPPEIIRGLDMALDDFGDVPLAVKVSSLLEDHLGADFSNVYPTRFVGNVGRKKERLQALVNAVAESYASVLAPEPIAYRAEHGLIDFDEDIGILIQEAVGMQINEYHLPAFSGLAREASAAYSRTDGENGTIRMTFGMDGHPADQLAGQCESVFALEDLRRIGPSAAACIEQEPKVKVINRTTSEVETISFRLFMKMYGRKIAGIERIFSDVCGNGFVELNPLAFDFDRGTLAATFGGLSQKTLLLDQIKGILRSLHEAYHSPIEIEFASNGSSLFLLKCHPLDRRMAARQATT